MTKQTRIILASSSPRRSELLATLGVDFQIEPSHIIEWPHQGEAVTDYSIRLARAKVDEVARRFSAGLVIGADTLVVVDQEVLGKPEDEADAARMLRLLSGRWHEVITGVALRDVATGRESADCASTLVRFSTLTDTEIDWYIGTGEPMDKAGAYGIQGHAGVFVEELSGNYHNVVGLPLTLVYQSAKLLGHSLLGSRD